MKIAFIITVYKGDKLAFFREAIESVVDQDFGFGNINIYLGVDGSVSDPIEKFIKNNDNLFYKITINKFNKGLAYTLNRLIEMLEEERYIFRMDSDDICKLDRVSKQVKFMECNKNISIVGGAIEELHDSNSIKMIRTYPKSTVEAKIRIPKASVFAHPTVCFRDSFFIQKFRYNQKLRINQDLALWFVVLLNDIQISNLDDVVLSLRISNDFFDRRGYKRAFSEFSVYFFGIKSLYGYNYRLVYPVIRFFSRLMPLFIIKLMYTKQLRSMLNN